MKIKNFDRSNLNSIRNEIDKALKSVGDNLGISLKTGACKFSLNDFTMKIEAATIGENGVVEDETRNCFKSDCDILGLKPEDLDKLIVINGTSYIISGLARRSYKLPIIVTQVSNGKKYKFPIDSIKKALGYPLWEPLSSIPEA